MKGPAVVAGDGGSRWRPAGGGSVSCHRSVRSPGHGSRGRTARAQRCGVAGGRGCVAARTPTVVLDQRNLTFSPRVLAVRVGTTVDFPNRDRVFLAAYVLAVDSGYFAVSDSRRQRP